MRAAILLDSVAGLSDQAIAQAQRVNRNTVRLWITEMPPLWRCRGTNLGEDAPPTRELCDQSYQ